MMKYKKIPGINLPVSNIIFGCCNPILIRDENGGEALLDLAYRHGFNTFDTAKVYGKSESVLGRWIKSAGIRDKVIIISKGCHPDPAPRLSAAALREDVESSISRLQTEYIDRYMLHRDDPDADIDEVLDVLNLYMKQGTIRKIGVSNWKHDRIEEVNKRATDKGMEGFTVSSPQLSPARQVGDPWGGGCVSISYDDKALSWYEDHPEIPVFAYSCLGHGVFSGKLNTKIPFLAKRSLDGAAREGFWCKENINRLKVAEDIAKQKGCGVAAIAIAWCMAHGFPVFPIVTVSSEDRIKKNLESLDISLSDEDVARLNKG